MPIPSNSRLKPLDKGMNKSGKLNAILLPVMMLAICFFIDWNLFFKQLSCFMNVPMLLVG